MKRVGLACLSWLLLTSLAAAHPLSPASLELEERTPESFALRFRRPAVHAGRLALDFPADCRLGAHHESSVGDARVTEATLLCDAPLVGRSVRVLGLSDLSLAAVLHARFRDGRAVQVLLGPERGSARLPRAPSPGQVFLDYLWLGIAHLLGGADHVLFVLGLLWLVRGLKRVLLTLTAFTLGHSITLSLSALSLVEVPTGPVELGIALSLVIVAYELAARPDEAGVSPRVPFLAVLSLGLLHGLGFAAALRETGLSAAQIPLSLFGFNLGVEFGQIALVLVLTPPLVLTRRLGEVPQKRLRVGVAYAIGSLSALWCIERALAL